MEEYRECEMATDKKKRKIGYSIWSLFAAITIFNTNFHSEWPKLSSECILIQISKPVERCHLHTSASMLVSLRLLSNYWTLILIRNSNFNFNSQSLLFYWTMAMITNESINSIRMIQTEEPSVHNTRHSRRHNFSIYFSPTPKLSAENVRNHKHKQT